MASVSELNNAQTRPYHIMSVCMSIMFLCFGIFGFVLVVPTNLRYELILFYSLHLMIDIIVFMRYRKYTYKVFLHTLSDSTLVLIRHDGKFVRDVLEEVNDAIASRE